MRKLRLLPLALLLLLPGSAAPAEPAGKAAPGLAGLWMGFKTLVTTGTSPPEVRWVTLFEDGTSFGDLPDRGLAGFDRRASRADPARAAYWGTWAVKGDAGTIQRPGVRVPTKIAVVGPDRLKLDGDLFYRCASVDGLRLQGSWTSYGNPADPGLARLPEGQRPAITFTADGRFTDHGLFATFLRSSYGAPDPRDAPGSGTYRFAGHALFLTYADGRTRQEAFTGLLGGDPATRNDIVFLRRSRLNRIP